MSTPDADAVVAALATLVAPLNQTLTDPSEIVLYDLRRDPGTVLAVAGHLTGTAVGDSAPDDLAEALASGDLSPRIARRTDPDSLELRTTTVFVPDGSGVTVAALSITYDVSLWQTVRAVAEAMLHGRRGLGEDAVAYQPPDEPGAPGDIDRVADQLLSHALRTSGVPVELMQKRHKLAIVRDLQAGGYFALRESVETAAKALGVTRFTIYNYLNELGAVPPER